MTKTATIATRSPSEYATGAEVFYEDARTVGEMINWTAGARPACHLSLATGDDGYAGGSELQTLKLRFSTSSGWQTRLAFRIVVSADTRSITVGVRCVMSAAQTGQVRVTIGASAATTVGTFTSADNGTEKTATILTSSSGTGSCDVLIECNHTVGSAADCYLRNVRVEDDAIAATDLPDPPDA